MTPKIPIPEGHTPNRSFSSLWDEYFELCNRVPQISAEHMRAVIEKRKLETSKTDKPQDE